MKIILSRKGFDSKFGGSPSPILPDGRMVSFPIPSSNDNRNYSDILVGKTEKMSNLINSLLPKKKFETCHLDPDLDYSALPRLTGWKPSFGAGKGAQTHLDNNGVKPGDLFLFFGWFRKTELKEGKLRFKRGKENKFQAIFGYLEIGEILKVGLKTEIPKWLEGHPHANAKRRGRPNNTIYVASERLSFSPDLPGGGILHFHENNRLTKYGETRSKWGLNKDIFGNCSISHHSEKSWMNGYFQSAKIGQEFVIECQTKKIEEWAYQIIKNNSIKAP